MATKNVSPHDVQNEAYSWGEVVVLKSFFFLSKQFYSRADCLKIIPKLFRSLSQTFSPWSSPLSNVYPLPILYARPHKAQNPPTVQLHCQERSVHYSRSASQGAETHPHRTLFTLQYYSVRNTEILVGKWYDCLRPVPGYQGFGGLGADSSTCDDTTKEEMEAHAKVQDYTTKVPSLGFHRAKPKNGDK